MAVQMKRLNNTNYLRSLLASAPIGMIVLDRRLMIVSFNSVAESIFGYSEGEVVGKHVKILLPEADRNRHAAYLRRNIRVGWPNRIGLGRVLGRVDVAQRRDGKVFPVQLTIGEARTPEGVVFTGFLHDITSRQQAQQELHELRDQLEHVSKMSAVTTLAQSLTHELNQPLTAIASYMEASRDLLEAADLDRAMMREALDEAATQAIRAGRIIRRMRDFIMEGESEKGVESIADVVNEVTVLGQFGPATKNVHLQLNLDPSMDRAVIDRTQIHQVLQNLIRNALEVMRDSPVQRLEISSRKVDDGALRITVADSGPGLAPGVRERLFEPFYTTKRHGMGLGLPICRAIIESHGGKLWAGPSHLGGTAFHFTLLTGTFPEVTHD
ncbi:sensor histidine kinase [Altererythrobacter sp. Root672]|uniref:sensor histidine kinase n=1 Tax=Altererythrobacter sp. Root672 TaxID=1736584 RepID=UPI0009E87EC9|nr:PAS domain-containing sensor histidine kinase [Altererythrobacter sp. Root672]